MDFLEMRVYYLFNDAKYDKMSTKLHKKFFDNKYFDKSAVE